MCTCEVIALCTYEVIALCTYEVIALCTCEVIALCTCEVIALCTCVHFSHKGLDQGIRIKGREMALVWHEKASRTALQTSSLLHTHTLLVKTHNMTREGVQSSSNSNHRLPNLFCGKRAPQLVISTTSNSNHPKKA